MDTQKQSFSIGWNFSTTTIFWVKISFKLNQRAIKFVISTPQEDFKKKQKKLTFSDTFKKFKPVLWLVKFLVCQFVGSLLTYFWYLPQIEFRFYVVIKLFLVANVKFFFNIIVRLSEFLFSLTLGHRRINK